MTMITSDPAACRRRPRRPLGAAASSSWRAGACRHLRPRLRRLGGDGAARERGRRVRAPWCRSRAARRCSISRAASSPPSSSRTADRACRADADPPRRHQGAHRATNRSRASSGTGAPARRGSLPSATAPTRSPSPSISPPHAADAPVLAAALAGQQKIFDDASLARRIRRSPRIREQIQQVQAEIAGLQAEVAAPTQAQRASPARSSRRSRALHARGSSASRMCSSSSGTWPTRRASRPTPSRRSPGQAEHRRRRGQHPQPQERSTRRRSPTICVTRSRSATSSTTTTAGRSRRARAHRSQGARGRHRHRSARPHAGRRHQSRRAAARPRAEGRPPRRRGEGAARSISTGCARACRRR